MDRLKNTFLILLILIASVFSAFKAYGQEDLATVYARFMETYKSGDLASSEKIMLDCLNGESGFTSPEFAFVWINLAVVYTEMGMFGEALDYLSKVEKCENDGKISEKTLALAYINKATILLMQRSFSQAIEYYDKGLRYYLTNSGKDHIYIIANGYQNLGITYTMMGDYYRSLEYFEKSYKILMRNGDKNIFLLFFGMAKANAGLKRYDLAVDFFNKSISQGVKDHGENYYKLVDVYYGYGEFLLSLNRTEEAGKIFRTALGICLKTFGEKNTYTSRSYKFLGDTKLTASQFDSALYYYQRSLISVSVNFNDRNIFSNPGIESALFDIRLLENLKSKSLAFEKLAMSEEANEERIRYMTSALSSMDLALKLIDNIRVNYMTEESRIYLAENEKATYYFAARMALELYSLSGADSSLRKSYLITQKAKAAVLRNEITGNDLLYSSSVPDSLRNRKTRLSAEIAGYTKKIIDEDLSGKADPQKLGFLKDTVFSMNRERERVNDEIRASIPEYDQLIRKTNPLSPESIMQSLTRKETIVDYFLSNSYEEGKRKLLIFILRKGGMACRETTLDSSFTHYAEVLKNTSVRSVTGKNATKDYIAALNYMYTRLVEPVEDLFRGNKLLIIPDEEIEWFPFEAFISGKPSENKTDFEGLDYLINTYSFSYSYSSSLLHPGKENTEKTNVFSFSPSYGDNGINALEGAKVEIARIHSRFGGEMYTGKDATREKFLDLIHYPAVFHLAMHSMSDSVNSKYSYLLFDKDEMTGQGGRLYNYEISLGRLNSPMVVLSACNSGTGTFYSGEGLMSLARSFVLAGASTVVKTAWEINDESSSRIISDFYMYLAEGKRKDDALRLAKLRYLKNSSPSFVNPYYWAAYEVLGNTDPIVRGNKIYFGIGFALLAVILSVYLMRRWIFPARTE